MEETKKCPKCSGEMIKGQFGQPQINFYHGTSPRSLWTGLISNKNVYKLQPFRCEKCNFIEVYGLK